MRFVVAAAFLAVLAACGETPAPAGEAQAAEPAMLTGVYRAASDGARIKTGNLSIERGGLLFDKGVILYTRELAPRRGSDRIARDGDSYAAAVVGPAELMVELRRVTEQTLEEGAYSLCGDDQPGYVAIAYEERATTVTVMVFAGDEPPGPMATQSRLCATLAYTAPDGARTRTGVVLW